MLQHVKAIRACNIYLQLFQLIILKFNNFFTFGANHVVMVLTHMPVFIPYDAVFKCEFGGKAITAHKIKGVRNKLRRQCDTVLRGNFYEILFRYVPLGLQKDFQNLYPILQIIDILMLKELSKLLFFLEVYLLH